MIGHTQYDFSSETAVVTGSTKGIGQAITARLAEHGIRITAGSTDVTETAQTRYEAEQKVESDTDRTARPLQDRGKRRPLGCLEQPESLVGAVLWIASDRADSVVGNIILTSGGDNPA